VPSFAAIVTTMPYWFTIAETTERSSGSSSR
jgi:hypothetical protein